ncbi:hypothetical protein VYU27_008552, partial [Nannochloropsis oceanica]
PFHTAVEHHHASSRGGGEEGVLPTLTLGSSGYDGLGGAVEEEGSTSPTTNPPSPSPPLPPSLPPSLPTRRGSATAAAGAHRASLSSSSLSPPSAGKGDVDTSKLLKQLRKEVKLLNAENSHLEASLQHQTKELHAAAEALAHLHSKAAAREGELLDEVEEVQKVKRVDKHQFSQVLAQKDAALREMESQLLQLETLRKERQDWREEKDTLKEELEMARSNQERGVEGLRQELREAQGALDEAKLQHSAWARQTQRREAELEGTIAELTASLAAKQRELETLKASFHSLGDNSQTTDLELHRLQQELQATQGALELERQHVVTLQREVRAQQHEMSSAAAAWREEKDAGEVKTRKQQREIEKLERGLEEERLKREEAERGGGGGGGEGRKEGRNEEMEGRLKVLSEQLVKKQGALDTALSSSYALEARLTASEERVRTLEGQLAMTDYDVESPADDVHSAGVRSRSTFVSSTKPSSSSSSFTLLPPSSSSSTFPGRRSAFPPLRPLSRLPFLQRHPAVLDVANGMDKVFVACIHYLRTFPWVRLLLMMYLFFMHIYVFSVVGWQAGRIETIHSDTGGSFLEPVKGE